MVTVQSVFVVTSACMCVCVSRIYEGHILPGDGRRHCAGAEERQPQPSVWSVHKKKLNKPSYNVTSSQSVRIK